MKRYWYISFVLVAFWVSLIYLWSSVEFQNTDNFLFTQWAESEDLRSIDSLWIDFDIDASEVIFEIQSDIWSIVTQDCEWSDLSLLDTSGEYEACDDAILFNSIDETSWFTNLILQSNLNQRIYPWRKFETEVWILNYFQWDYISVEGYELNSKWLPWSIVRVKVSNSSIFMQVLAVTTTWISSLFQKKISDISSNKVGIGLSDTNSVIFIIGEDSIDSQIEVDSELIVWLRAFNEWVWLTNINFTNL